MILQVVSKRREIELYEREERQGASQEHDPVKWHVPSMEKEVTKELSMQQ